MKLRNCARTKLPFLSHDRYILGVLLLTLFYAELNGGDDGVASYQEYLKLKDC
jgi:hypothetical protein